MTQHHGERNNDENADVPRLLALTAEPHRPALDTDPDTSVARSLILHMMSEHGAWDALGVDPIDLEHRHISLHEQNVCAHALPDIRFRPTRALMGMLARQRQRDELVAQHEPAVTPTPRA